MIAGNYMMNPGDSAEKADLSCLPAPEFPNICSPRATDVAWRWGLVAQHSDLTVVQASWALRKEDPLTRSAWAFSKCLSDGEDLDRYSAIAQAYHLTFTEPNTAAQLEGLLLCSLDNEEISRHLGLAPEAIQTFHDLYFDVRGRTKSWLVAKLLNGHPVPEIDPADTRLLMRQVAIVHGWDVVRPLFFSTGEPTPASLQAALGAIGSNVVHQLLRASCSQASGVRGLQSMVESLRPTPTDGGQESTNEAMGVELMRFLTSLPMEVADPNDPANRSLPAREPRGHEGVVPKR